MLYKFYRSKYIHVILWLILIFVNFKTASAQPKPYFHQTSINLGNILEGEFQKITYTLQNKGKDTLFIAHIETVCGCMATQKAPSWVAPKQKESITILFDTREMIGLVNKQIRVFYKHDFYNPTTLRFSAHVSPVESSFETFMPHEIGILRMRSPLIFAGNVPQNTEKKFELKITNPNEFPVSVEIFALPTYVSSKKSSYIIAPKTENAIELFFLGNMVPNGVLTNDTLKIRYKQEKEYIIINLPLEVSQY